LAPAADAALEAAIVRATRLGPAGTALKAAFAAPLLALGVLTFVRAPVFGSDSDVLNASAHWYPGGTQVRLHEADSLTAAEKYEEAEAILEALLAEWPDLPRTHERLVV